MLDSKAVENMLHTDFLSFSLTYMREAKYCEHFAIQFIPVHNYQSL